MASEIVTRISIFFGNTMFRPRSAASAWPESWTDSTHPSLEPRPTSEPVGVVVLAPMVGPSGGDSTATAWVTKSTNQRYRARCTMHDARCTIMHDLSCVWIDRARMRADGYKSIDQSPRRDCEPRDSAAARRSNRRRRSRRPERRTARPGSAPTRRRPKKAGDPGRTRRAMQAGRQVDAWWWFAMLRLFSKLRWGEVYIRP